MHQKPFVLSNNQLTLYCHVQPGAKQSQLAGLYDHCLKVQLKAVPVEGKANKALINFLAEVLKCSRSNISIKSGFNQRRKTLIIEHIDTMPPVLEKLCE